MQQGAGGMVAGAMQIYYPPSIIPVLFNALIIAFLLL